MLKIFLLYQCWINKSFVMIIFPRTTRLFQRRFKFLRTLYADCYSHKAIDYKCFNPQVSLVTCDPFRFSDYLPCFLILNRFWYLFLIFTCVGCRDFMRKISLFHSVWSRHSTHVTNCGTPGWSLLVSAFTQILIMICPWGNISLNS